MPNYLNVSIKQLIEPQTVERMLAACETPRERALIALLYVTGCRPIEALKLCRKDVDLVVAENEFGQFCTVKLYTAKQQHVKGFNIAERRLKLFLDYPFIHYFLDYADAHTNPDAFLFPISRQKVHSWVYKYSGKLLCPYNFRHNRAYRMKQGGAMDEELYSWFGWRDSRSSSPYRTGHEMPRKVVIT